MRLFFLGNKAAFYSTTIRIMGLFLIFSSIPAWATPSEKCMKMYRHFPMEAAIPYCKLAAEKGNAAAQTRLGTYYAYKGSNTKEAKDGVFWLRKAAAQNHPDAQFILGVLYELGRPVTKDEAESRVWYEKAASQGHPEAGFNLGLSYFRNLTNRDPEKAIEWFTHAANKGSIFAQYNLGLIYYDGKITAQNKVESSKWFKVAAQNDYPRAQHRMGIAYIFGIGVNKDYLKAIEWFKKASIKNYSFSQYALGVIFQYGLGVNPSLETAKRWYNKSASKRYEKSLNALASIERKESVPVEYALNGIDRTSFYVLAFISRLPAAKISYDNACEELTDDKFTLNKNDAHKKLLKRCEERILKTKSAKDIFLFATSKFDTSSTGLFKKERNTNEIMNLKKRITLERKSAKMGYFEAQYDLGTICLMFDPQHNLCHENEAEMWIRLAAEQSQPSLYCMASRVYPDNPRKQLEWYTLAAKASEGCGIEKLALYYIKKETVFLPVAQAWYKQFGIITKKIMQNEGVNKMILQLLTQRFEEQYKSKKGEGKMDTEQESLSFKYLKDIQNSEVNNLGIPKSFRTRNSY